MLMPKISEAQVSEMDAVLEKMMDLRLKLTKNNSTILKQNKKTGEQIKKKTGKKTIANEKRPKYIPRFKPKVKFANFCVKIWKQILYTFYEIMPG